MKSVPVRIALVEDDTDLSALVSRALREDGFDVVTAVDGTSALSLSMEDVDAIVLDIGLPDADGRDVCLAWRARGLDTPVLFLTAREAVTDRLSGFAAGGDDYLVKPFAVAELLARLRALLRRAPTGNQELTTGVALDPMMHAIVAGEVEIALTPTEFRVLAALASSRSQVTSKRAVTAAAWPDGAIVNSNTLDVYLRRVRRKLARVPGAPTIETVRGVGYRLI